MEFRTGNELGERSSFVFGHLGELRQGRGDLEAAILEYGRAIEADPESAQLFLRRAMARHLAGDLEGAREDYARAIGLSPSAAGAWANRGQARLALGDPRGALADLERALSLDPDAAAIRTALGDALAALGDYQGAIARWNEAIAAEPASPCVEPLRGRIEDAEDAIRTLSNLGAAAATREERLSRARGYAWRSRTAGDPAPDLRSALALLPEEGADPLTGRVLAESLLAAGYAAESFGLLSGALEGELDPRTALAGARAAALFAAQEEGGRCVLLEPAGVVGPADPRSEAFRLLDAASRRPLLLFDALADPAFASLRADPRWREFRSRILPRG